MARMHTMILMIVVIEIALAVFAYSNDPMDIREGRIVSNSTSMTRFLLKPADWSADSFFSWLKDNKLLGLIAGAIVIGTFIIAKDFAWRAGIVATFITFGAVLFHLFSFIFAGFPGSGSDGFKLTITFILISPLLIYYIIGIIDYVSSPTS